jgi:hypothetical protein
VARNIKEYQEYYGLDNSQATFEHVYQMICSEKVDNKFNKLHVAVKEATEYVNAIQTDKKLEGVATVLYLVQTGSPKNREQLIKDFKNWSEDKAKRFSDKYILECIDYLEETSVISLDICGNYELTRNAF